MNEICHIYLVTTVLEGTALSKFLHLCTEMFKQGEKKAKKPHYSSRTTKTPEITQMSIITIGKSIVIQNNKY